MLLFHVETSFHIKLIIYNVLRKNVKLFNFCLWAIMFFSYYSSLWSLSCWFSLLKANQIFDVCEMEYIHLFTYWGINEPPFVLFIICCIKRVADNLFKWWIHASIFVWIIENVRRAVVFDFQIHFVSSCMNETNWVFGVHVWVVDARETVLSVIDSWCE